MKVYPSLAVAVKVQVEPYSNSPVPVTVPPLTGSAVAMMSNIVAGIPTQSTSNPYEKPLLMLLP